MAFRLAEMTSFSRMARTVSDVYRKVRVLSEMEDVKADSLGMEDVTVSWRCIVPYYSNVP